MRSPTLGSGLLALVLTAAVFAPGAQADPAGPADPVKPSLTDIRAAREKASAAKSRVERIQDELDAANAELELASINASKAAEAWNGARWKASKARTAKRAAAAASVLADRTMVRQKADYRDSVITANSMGIDLSAAGAFVAADGMESLLERSAAFDHVQAMFARQRVDFIEAADAADDAEAAAVQAADAAVRTATEARVARDRAQASAEAATATANRIGQRQTRLVRTMARLQGVSVALVKRRQNALEEERRTARAAAAPRATPVRHPSPAADPEPAKPAKPVAPAPPQPADDPPAPARGAEAAIAFARAQLGEPYVWGASGPNSWDCSGLTAEAWAAGGKSLPHYSVAQYDASTPISVSQLRPGDLVFWGDSNSPSSIFHVALYAGNGQIIHAPRTGRPVVEESLYYWRTPDFFARP